MPVRLTTEAISAGYDGPPILSDVSLAVANGKMTVLVGPNGSGKSTLLKTMARILSPTTGQVLLDGKSIHASKSRDVARAMGILPQGPIAPEGLTVRELVGQGRFPHQGLMRQWTRQDEDAVEKAMATALVTEFADRPVDSLSGGQRQRCWIAMVLAQETDLLLLDEPTTFLDLKVQVDLMELLADLAHGGGRTLVVVLHELSLAAAYADHLVMMKDGQIACEGAPDAIFTADRLKEVFDLDAHVVRDATTGHLVCVPLGTHARRKAAVRVA
ncbi:iron3+ dicitrate transport ATP-binding protein FecE [Pelagibacterium halotolerans B2]|uniref:Iron3+ dicitrate transport ATP-binding protein FecE n=2 Tax=Pelagibacterium TaxID=1082930 RepID=G4R8B9_PELHB|nr:iron3+ dicitrate transport ATP-binding protein FecE [Pelagibacterium halotolerans B2]QJR20510.1 ABC transporter ATP-binding protein [Pelagibacterium halotolerans]